MNDRNMPTPLWPTAMAFAENVTPPTLTRYDPPL